MGWRREIAAFAWGLSLGVMASFVVPEVFEVVGWDDAADVWRSYCGIPE